MSRATLGILLLLAFGTVVAAQDAPGTAAPAERGGALRDEVGEMVDAYLLMKVQERLALSDEQMLKVMPPIRKYHTERRDLDRRRFRLLMEMRDALASGSAKEDRLAILLRDFKAVEGDLQATMRRNLDAVDAILTPVQQVKYRLLEFEIDRHLRALRHRAWQHRGTRGPAAGDSDLPGDDLGPRPRRR
jgi:hypothetical protein